MKNKVLKIIKWYLVYHIIIDLCFLGLLLYWHCTESDYVWYLRMMKEPSMIIKTLLYLPPIIIYAPFELLHNLFVYFFK